MLGIFLRIMGKLVGKDDNLSAIYESTFYEIRKYRSLTTILSDTACYRDSFTFLSYGNCFETVCVNHGDALRTESSVLGYCDSRQVWSCSTQLTLRTKVASSIFMLDSYDGRASMGGANMLNSRTHKAVTSVSKTRRAF
jgi:hypothetical protein